VVFKDNGCVDMKQCIFIFKLSEEKLKDYL